MVRVDARDDESIGGAISHVLSDRGVGQAIAPAGAPPEWTAQLPDLIVRWTARPATRIEGVRSERFGTVLRHGVGSGRSGNHTEGDAWALVVPGASRPVDLTRAPRLEDVAATAAALSGLDTSGMAGEPLLQR